MQKAIFKDFFRFIFIRISGVTVGLDVFTQRLKYENVCQIFNVPPSMSVMAWLQFDIDWDGNRIIQNVIGMSTVCKLWGNSVWIHLDGTQIRGKSRDIIKSTSVITCYNRKFSQAYNSSHATSKTSRFLPIRQKLINNFWRAAQTAPYFTCQI